MPSSPVSMLLEAEVQLQDSSVKYTSEAMSLRHFPFSVNNLKSYILVRWPSTESDQQSIISLSLLQIELRSLSLVN